MAISKGSKSNTRDGRRDGRVVLLLRTGLLGFLDDLLETAKDLLVSLWCVVLKVLLDDALLVFHLVVSPRLLHRQPRTLLLLCFLAFVLCFCALFAVGLFFSFFFSTTKTRQQRKMAGTLKESDEWEDETDSSYEGSDTSSDDSDSGDEERNTTERPSKPFGFQCLSFFFLFLEADVVVPSQKISTTLPYPFPFHHLLS